MKLTTQIGIICVLLVIFAKTLISPLIYLNYELRKDYIIQNFCENKERPELNCDGKCYLAKQLKASQQEDEEQATLRFMEKLMSIEYLEVKNDALSKEESTLWLHSLQIEVIPSLFAKFSPSAPFHPPIS